MVEITTRTPWRLKAHWLETCNCEPGCDCNFGGFPDYGGCEAIDGIEIVEGNYGNVDLAGVRVVTAWKWPKAIHEGHGQLVLFVDASATPEQVEAVTAIVSGREGGMPWEAFAATLDRFEGPVLTPIEMTIEGRRSHFCIPDVLEANLTPLKNPATGKEHEVHIVFPKGGIIWNDGDAATTETMRITHGDLRFAYPGRSAFYALTEWSNHQ